MANIVLLPRALAGLSDHDSEVQRALQYRALELYSWWPEGLPEPTKPDFYPPVWRDPLPDPAVSPPRRRSVTTRPRRDRASTERSRTLPDRIRAWSGKPALNVHKIIALVVRAESGIPRDGLVQSVSRVTQSKSAYGAVASLLTDSGNAYGLVFEDVNGVIRLHPDVAELVLSLPWRVG